MDPEAVVALAWAASGSGIRQTWGKESPLDTARAASTSDRTVCARQGAGRVAGTQRQPPGEREGSASSQAGRGSLLQGLLVEVAGHAATIVCRLGGARVRGVF